MQVFLDTTDVEALPDPFIWSNDGLPVNNFANDLLELQPDRDAESLSQDHCQSGKGPFDFTHILEPSLDVLSIPDELKFIMQYRQCFV
jgi:hypothetical protein